MRRLILTNVGVAVAYFVFGRLALLLAVPPGYATGIWPAAGVALAAALAFGRGVWPGVLVGSVLVNVSTGPGVALPLAIGAGAALQALAGAEGIRRFVGYPNALEDERAIAKFLALGGPLACIVSSSVGVSALLYFGVIGWADAGSHWVTWWIGDTIGAVLFGPVVLIGLGEPRRVWRARAVPVGVPLLVSFSVIVSLFVYASHLLESRTRSRLEVRARDVGHGLSSALDTDIQVLRAMQSLFESSGPVDREQFARFVHRYVTEDTGIQALEWIPRVAHEDRAAAELAARADGHAGFTFTELHADGEVVKAGARDEYFPVYFVEPLGPNATALGLDLASNPARKRALDTATRTGGIVATEPITLVQETARQSGFLIFAPVYDADTPGTERQPRGFALAVLRVGDLLASAVSELGHGDFDIDLEDVTSGEPTKLSPGADVGMDGADETLTVRHEFDVGGRRWSLGLTPTASYASALRSSDALGILVGGCAFSALLGALLLLVTGRADRIQRLVDQRTDEIRKSNERLAALSARLQALLDCSVNFIMVAIEPSGVISLFNSGAETILGYSADEVLGKESPRLLHVADELASRSRDLTAELGRPIEGMDVFLAKPLADGFETRQWTYVRKDGSTFPGELTVTPLTSGGELLGFFGVAVDITERRMSEEAMATARDEALRLARAKSDFLANMSHEIRTPMNGVIGMVQLLESTRLDTEQREYVGTVRKSSEALMAVINDILDFSKLEAGKLLRESVPFALRDLVEDAAGIMRAGARAKGLELSTDIRADVPHRVAGDPTRLRQVLLNLLGNAVKFTVKGEIVLRAALEEPAGADPVVRFEVEDTGVGIDEEAQEHIFSPFAQEDASVTRKFGGTGLGLAISKRLVDLQGGAMGVSSVKGEGSRFWFTLPFTSAPPAATAPPGRTAAPPPTPGTEILVAEDNSINQRVLRGMLELLGYAVEVVADGEQAVEAWRRGSHAAVLMDCQMPVLDGYSATRRIRGLESGGRRTPIIAVTAHALRGEREKATAAGMDDFITKPFDADDLRTALGKWITTDPATDADGPVAEER